MKKFAFCMIVMLLSAAICFAQSKRNASSKPKPPATDKISIDGVRVNNFYKRNGGNYGDVVNLISGTNAVQFDKNRNTFQLTVEAITPAGFKRNQRLLETRFLTLLGITKTDACKLKVEASKNSPGGWDGKTFGLSFCR